MSSTSLEFGLNPRSGSFFFQLIKPPWHPFCASTASLLNSIFKLSTLKDENRSRKHQDSRAMESTKLGHLLP